MFNIIFATHRLRDEHVIEPLVQSLRLIPDRVIHEVLELILKLDEFLLRDGRSRHDMEGEMN